MQSLKWMEEVAGLHGLQSSLRKSSHSSGSGGGCVGVAIDGNGKVVVLDTTDPTGPQLRMSAAGLAKLREFARANPKL